MFQKDEGNEKEDEGQTAPVEVRLVESSLWFTHSVQEGKTCFI